MNTPTFSPHHSLPDASLRKLHVARRQLALISQWIAPAAQQPNQEPLLDMDRANLSWCLSKFVAYFDGVLATIEPMAQRNAISRPDGEA